jgi:hypothetical protein
LIPREQPSRARAPAERGARPRFLFTTHAGFFGRTTDLGACDPPVLDSICHGRRLRAAQDHDIRACERIFECSILL